MDATGFIVAAATIIFGLMKLAETQGWIPAGPVAKSALERAELAEAELRRKLKENSELRTRTDLQALVDAVTRMSDIQKQVLDKLGDLNGSLRASADAHAATADTLRATTEAVKILATGKQMDGI